MADLVQIIRGGVKRAVPAASVDGVACVKLATATAASDATIDFTAASYFDGTYDRLQLVGFCVAPATNSVQPIIRISTDATWRATSYAGSLWYNYTTTVAGIAPITTGLAIWVASAGNASNRSASFIVDFLNPNNSAQYKGIMGHGSITDDAGAYSGVGFTGRWEGGTQAIDGIRFLFSSGNVASGKFTLYGFK